MLISLLIGLRELLHAYNNKIADLHSTRIFLAHKIFFIANFDLRFNQIVRFLNDWRQRCLTVKGKISNSINFRREVVESMKLSNEISYRVTSTETEVDDDNKLIHLYNHAKI